MAHPVNYTLMLGPGRLTQPAIERNPFAVAMRAVLDFGYGQEKNYPQKENIKSQLNRRARPKSHPGHPGRRLLPKTKKPAPRRRRSRSTQLTEQPVAQIRQGVGLAAEAGQSGDTQALSDIEDVDSESVRELAEEGQDFEAGIISGVENAPDPDVSEVKTHEVPEDDVPEEYRNQN